MEKQRIEEIAVNRLKLIAPLTDPVLDKDKRQMLKEKICIQSGLSERTIRRYLNLYAEKGFDGLKPQVPGRGGNSCIPQEVLLEASALRREVPKRSINELIRILEWEGKVEPGTLKRSTLQDQLSYHGYSSRQMQTYAATGTSARRYQKPWRNYLWQSDIKYGIYVGGQPTYMVCFLDDCTRNIMHSQFYSTLDQKIVQDCFRKALLKQGAPDSVYFDNGAQFRTHWMKRACGKLGIRLLYARPYSPEGKGKQERYNQTVDSFLREAQLAKPKDLAALNHLYRVWMEECYLHKGHSALEGKSPYEAYQRDSHELRMLAPETVADAFLSCEKPKIDKCGCISFCGQKYEVELGLSMIHKDVDVVYDPADISRVSIECEGFPSCTAKPLIIGHNTSPKVKLPEHLEKMEPQSSRLLDAASKKNELHQSTRHTAISFTGIDTMKKEGGL
ncbi:DDE-type integrase/transposase/recombinase [Faecalicatena contorta]|uniref:Mu transposase, C-terminal n=1 Tax=Faecalicatena contorta TaxID=39482 RepID=A0A316A1Z7_9FIRM|nr:DDE-type integrase/transposase/recombinase [Faecalicatena contorta]PWJ51572.1 Mu transposase-like protein [Faecalicatena contorta]SUQ13128.1 Mu transposase, C-terminal [Faecalicatena contorta]